MASIVQGFVTEQQVITVLNDDTSMNAVITAQSADSWLVSSITLSGASVIILFTRTVASS